MNGFWKYFWLIYTLFFAIPFPMLIYYNTMDEETGLTNPWLALGFLALSVVLWVIVLIDWCKKWVLATFIMRKNMLRLLKDGVIKDARVLSKKEIGTTGNGSIVTEVTCTLKNFVGTDITEQVALSDSKPELRRYDQGKTIQLRIDDKLKSMPYLTIDGVRIKIKTVRIILLCLAWLFVVAALLWYYGYSYVLENNGTGWRFLKFYHPLVLCPVILLFSRIGFGKLLSVFLGGSAESNLRLKYYGMRTEAQVLNAEQTGTYINEQPQVRFELQYQDDLGKNHVVSLKKIVLLMDLGEVKKAAIPVFYLKDKPEQVGFASDVEA